MKILLMEDEPTIRLIVTDFLQHNGYQVLVCEDGTQAMKLVDQEDFDFAILDIMVPGPNGHVILKHIKHKNSDIPVLMLSALGDDANQSEAFDALADDYVVKPFSPILLLKRIEAISRRVIKEPHNTSGLELVNESYQAYFNGTSLSLTLTEFYLLEFFMKHPRSILSRAQLLDVIAPDDYMVNDRVVDAHIKNLRKKLPKAYIQTKIGVGYQWMEDAQ